MHPGRPVVLVGAATVVAILSGFFLLHAYQAAAPMPNYDPSKNLVRTDFPSWPYPRGIRDTRKDDGTLFHLRGSNREFTLTQINGSQPTIDWFPDRHPVPPPPVIDGKVGAYGACVNAT